MSRGKTVPLQEKVKIFEKYFEDKDEYLKKYGVAKKISAATVFTFDEVTCPIGVWQDNLRARYENKNLENVDTALFKKLENLGILEGEKRKRISDEEKYKILRKYIEENPKEKITIDTVLSDGTPIGRYRNELRAKYNNENNRGDKHISDDLAKKLEDLGILESEKRKRTSDEERYDIISKYIKENPNEKITIDTVSKDGTPIGQYRNDFRAKYNDMKNGGDKKHISVDLVKKLQKVGVLDYDYSEIKNKTGLQQEEIDYIVRKYGSVEEFSRLFKMGEIKSENLDPSRIEKLKNNRYIDIKNPGSEREENYSNLCVAILREGLEGYGAVGFYDEGNLKDGLSKLKPRELMVLKARFGLDDGLKMTLEAIGKTPGISERFEEVSKDTVRYLEARALRNMRRLSHGSRNFVAMLNVNGESLENRIAQEEIKITQEEMRIAQEEKEIEQGKKRIEQEEKRIEQEKKGMEQEKKEISQEESKIVSGAYYRISNDKIGNEDVNAKNIEVFAKGIKIEHLELSTRPKRLCDEKNIIYISDLADKSLGDLPFGKGSLKELTGKLRVLGIILPIDNETKFITGNAAAEIVDDIRNLNTQREALEQKKRALAQREETLAREKGTVKNAFFKRREDVAKDKKHLEELMQIKKPYDYYMSDEYSIFKENVMAEKDTKNDIPDVELQEESNDTAGEKLDVLEGKLAKIETLNAELAKISEAKQKLEEEVARLEGDLKNKGNKGKDSNNPNRNEGIGK